MRFLGLLLFTQTCSGWMNGTVDLGYGFDENTLYWPGMPSFNLSEVVRMQKPFYMAANKFSAAEHGGTHLDAPFHFNPDGWKVPDIPLDRLIVPGVVVDMQEAAANDSDAEATAQDLVEWERTYGPLPDPVAVIFNFGWAKKFPNRTEYFGIIGNNDSDIHFPGVSEDAAEWLVNSGKVVGVGVDTASIDTGVNSEFPAHQVLTKANIYLMENLALASAELPPRGFNLIVMPMKIIDGTGAPLRIVAQPASSAATFYSRILSWIVSIWMMIRGSFKS